MPLELTDTGCDRTSSDACDKMASTDTKALKVIPDVKFGMNLFSETLRMTIIAIITIRLVVMQRIHHSHQL